MWLEILGYFIVVQFLLFYLREISQPVAMGWTALI